MHLLCWILNTVSCFGITSVAAYIHVAHSLFKVVMITNYEPPGGKTTNVVSEQV